MKLENLFRWSVIDGTVTYAGTGTPSSPDFRWDRFLFKLVIALLVVVFLGPVAIALIVVWIILSFMFAFLAPLGSGLFGFLVKHLLLFHTAKSVFGPKKLLPVLDVRILDHTGQSHLVRITGEVVRGNINVGDDVEIKGPLKGGTMLFRRGWNRHINSEIKVKGG